MEEDAKKPVSVLRKEDFPRIKDPVESTSKEDRDNLENKSATIGQAGTSLGHESKSKLAPHVEEWWKKNQKSRPHRARYPLKKKETRKKINFVEPVHSNSSIVTIIDTDFGRKSPFGSSMSEDVRYVNIGCLEIRCEVGDHHSREFTLLLRSRFCKMITCFIYGVLIPSCFVVPVLIYGEALMKKD